MIKKVHASVPVDLPALDSRKKPTEVSLTVDLDAAPGVPSLLIQCYAPHVAAHVIQLLIDNPKRVRLVVDNEGD